MNVAVTWLSKGLGVAKAVAEQVMKGPVPEPVPVEPAEPKQKKAKAKKNSQRASRTRFPQQPDFVEDVYQIVKELLNGEQSGELRLKQVRARLPKQDWRIPHGALCQLIYAGRIRWRGTQFTVLTPVAA